MFGVGPDSTTTGCTDVIEAFSSIGVYTPQTAPAAAQRPVEVESAPSPPSPTRIASQALPPYLSLKVSSDPRIGVTILEVQDSETGETTQQYPSEAALAYREAAGLLQSRSAPRQEIDLDVYDNEDPFGASESRLPTGGFSPARPAEPTGAEFSGLSFGGTAGTDGARGTAISINL